MKQILSQVTELMKPFQLYAVGGCVRDYLLGIEPKDYDFCTNASPDEIEACIKKAGRRAYLVGKRFGTIGCKIENQMIEITTFRTESYEKNNRKPEVDFVSNIEVDLLRRDFTINAMALKMSNNEKGGMKLLDPSGGKKDLIESVLKAVGHPKQRFKEDSLRILRAIRFAGRFNMKIEDKTLEKMKSGAIQILSISKERWMQEMDKILMDDNVSYSLELLFETGLFKYMIPELSLQYKYDQNSKYHDFPLHTHTILVTSSTPKDINLRWAGLLHDIAKPFVRTEKIRQLYPGTDIQISNYIGHEELGADMVDRIATHLKWSNERRKAVVELVKNHLKDDCQLRQYDNQAKRGKDNDKEM